MIIVCDPEIFYNCFAPSTTMMPLVLVPCALLSCLWAPAGAPRRALPAVDRATPSSGAGDTTHSGARVRLARGISAPDSVLELITPTILEATRPACPSARHVCRMPALPAQAGSGHQRHCLRRRRNSTTRHKCGVRDSETAWCVRWRCGTCVSGAHALPFLRVVLSCAGAPLRCTFSFERRSCSAALASLAWCLALGLSRPVGCDTQECVSVDQVVCAR